MEEEAGATWCHDHHHHLRIVSVSRLTARKGAGDLGATIRTAAALYLYLSFTVIGGGPGRADLVAGLGATDPARIRLAGTLPPPSIPPLLARADIFLSAARTEAFGLAALEAAGVGLVVVAPDVDGVAQALAPAAAHQAPPSSASPSTTITPTPTTTTRRVFLVPPAAGPAGLAAAVVEAAAGLRASASASSLPPSTPSLAPLAAVLTDHCWHRAGAAAVRLYERVVEMDAHHPFFPPLLPGHPLTVAARVVVHAGLRMWALLLNALDPPGRVGSVCVELR